MHILAIIEAIAVTGPAKNLLGFWNWTRTAEARDSGADLSFSVATFARGEEPASPFLHAVRDSGIPAHVIRERFRFDPAVLPRIRTIAAGADVIQTHNVKSHFLVKAAGLHATAPWMAFHHGYTATDFKMGLYNQLDRWSLRSARRVVTLCRAFAPLLESRGVSPERIRVLHNSAVPPAPVPGEDTARLRAQFGIAPDESAILTIGRLSKEKGHADLIEGLARLTSLAPDARWKVVIAGSGPERPALERLAAERGVAGRVVFAGYITGVAPLYALADVFVLPSHSEGSSNVLLEAMAARVPVVATRAGGTPEIANDDCALLTPVRDPEALARALARMLGSPELRTRLADAALRRVGAEFSPGRFRQTLAGFYRDLDPRA